MELQAVKDPGIPETGHWQARARAEETLSYEGRADCLDHAKEHARDVLALVAECERLRVAGNELARLVRDTIPPGHHHRCNSRHGEKCDCFMRRYADEVAAVAEWAALGEADDE